MTCTSCVCVSVYVGVCTHGMCPYSCGVCAKVRNHSFNSVCVCSHPCGKGDIPSHTPLGQGCIPLSVCVQCPGTAMCVHMGDAFP